MQQDDPIYKAFLSELEGLERFRIAYSGLNPHVPLRGDDPDVRRLIEALAFFSARGRLASERGVARQTQRIFQQHFSYLCDPIPAMTMLQAQPSSRFVDAEVVPRGTRVRITQPAAPNEPERVLLCRSLANIRLLPLALEGVDSIDRDDGSHRLVFRFESVFPRNDQVGELNLLINHMDDLLSSMGVVYELKKNLRSAGVVFDYNIGPRTKGEPVEVYFGAPEYEPHEVLPCEHPLQRVRQSLHYPQQELYMNLQVDAAPRDWDAFCIYLDLAPGWPRELELAREAFKLNVVPLENLSAEGADTVTDDGTQDRQLLRHPDSQTAAVYHSLVGAHKIDDGAMTPLVPGVVETVAESYELEYEGAAEKRRAFILLNAPDAFEQPLRVAVDALWHQPSLCNQPLRSPTVELVDLALEAVDWQLVGPLVPGRDNPLAIEQEKLLHLVSSKNERLLERPSLLFVLEAFGVAGEGYFGRLVDSIRKVVIEPKPFGKGNRGFKYVYHLTFDNLEPGELPLLDAFAIQLLELLTQWSIEEIVELRVEVTNLDDYPREYVN